MAEATDLLVRGPEVTAGFWIRRVSSPAAVAAATRRRKLAAGQRLVMLRTGEENKENIPPTGYVVPPRQPWQQRGRRGSRKSPLPEWYPRTPLRDITAIVQALERRRLQAARAERVNRDREASPEGLSPVSSSPEGLRVSGHVSLVESTPNHVNVCGISSSPVEHPLPSPSPSSCSTQTDRSPGTLHQPETEGKLCRSIDQIEKIVKKNLKTVKEATAKRAAQRRTLMSMR